MQRTATYARGSRVRAADLNRAQDEAAGLKLATGAPAGTVALTGRDGRYWASPDTGVADGDTVVLDASKDWRQHKLRLVFVRLTAADQRMQDTAAWKRNDRTQAITVRTLDDALTGTGCAASDGVPEASSGHFGILLDELSAGADGVWLFADSDNGGALTLTNDTGAPLHCELDVEGSSASATSASDPSTVPGSLHGEATTADATWTTAITSTPDPSSTVTYRGMVSAIRDDGTEGGGWAFTVRVRRGATGDPVVGTAVFTLTDSDDVTWGVRAQASGGDVVLQVQGAAMKTITWRLDVETTVARIA